VLEGLGIQIPIFYGWGTCWIRARRPKRGLWRSYSTRKLRTRLFYGGESRGETRDQRWPGRLGHGRRTGSLEGLDHKEGGGGKKRPNHQRRGGAVRSGPTRFRAGVGTGGGTRSGGGPGKKTKPGFKKTRWSLMGRTPVIQARRCTQTGDLAPGPCRGGQPAGDQNPATKHGDTKPGGKGGAVLAPKTCGPGQGGPPGDAPGFARDPRDNARPSDFPRISRPPKKAGPGTFQPGIRALAGGFFGAPSKKTGGVRPGGRPASAGGRAKLREHGDTRWPKKWRARGRERVAWGPPPAGGHPVWGRLPTGSSLCVGRSHRGVRGRGPALGFSGGEHPRPSARAGDQRGTLL